MRIISAFSDDECCVCFTWRPKRGTTAASNWSGAGDERQIVLMIASSAEDSDEVVQVPANDGRANANHLSEVVVSMLESCMTYVVEIALSGR